ncbi:hypothetical protein EV145_11523 [Flavobacterium sp. 245]|nr:hypothetical protein EV145_11523 [Flavobacterium sp. 245]
MQKEKIIQSSLDILHVSIEKKMNEITSSGSRVS